MGIFLEGEIGQEGGMDLNIVDLQTANKMENSRFQTIICLCIYSYKMAREESESRDKRG